MSRSSAAAVASSRTGALFDSRTAPLALAVLVALAGCWLHWRFGHSWATTSGHAWGSDDAYITYRYAENLLNGRGPVFNPGEAPVEGYSNPLYLLAMVPLLAAVGRDGLYAASVVVNALVFAATLPLLARLTEKLIPDQPALRWIVPLFGAAFPPLWLAVASGLETIVVYALQLALVTVIVAPPQRRAGLAAGTIAVLLVLTRVDGFIVPLAAAMPLWLAGERRRAAAIVLPCAAALAAITLWRLSYYGLPLPNVVYAKVHGQLHERFYAAGLRLLFEIPGTGILPWLVLPVAVAVPLWRRIRSHGLRELSHPDVTVTGLPLVLLGYWYFVGGDVYSERFLLLAYPLGLLSLFARLPDAKAAALVVAITSAIPFAADGRYGYGAKPYDMWIETGRFLADRHPGALLAIDAAGKVPYFSRLEIVDMLGLNDRHIASLPNVGFRQAGHNKRDAGYVLARRPDLIAAWRSTDFDMVWGMTRDRYLPAGYCPRYLVYSGRDRVPTPILDLTTVPPAQWRQIPTAWEYMLLDRRAPCALG